VIQFARTTDPLALPGRLHYVERDHSFRFESASSDLESARTGGEGEASLALGTLQLHFGVETGLVLYADGYCPKQSWRPDKLAMPTAATGAVQVTLDRDVVPGVGYRVDGLVRVEAVHVVSARWLRLSGGTPPDPAAEYVEVAQGVVLEIRSGALLALWLHPEP